MRIEWLTPDQQRWLDLLTPPGRVLKRWDRGGGFNYWAETKRGLMEYHMDDDASELGLVPFGVLEEEDTDSDRLRLWRLRRDWLSECAGLMRWLVGTYDAKARCLENASSGDGEILIGYTRGSAFVRWCDRRRDRQTGEITWAKWRGWNHPAADLEGLAPRLDLVLRKAMPPEGKGRR